MVIFGATPKLRNMSDVRNLDEYKSALGKVLRQHRNKAGLTLEKCAHMAGIHWTYLSSVENGNRNLGVENLVRIADALEVSLSRIFADLDKLF